MPKEIDPDLKKAYEALIEEQKKLADPRRIYTRSDQLYPDPRFRPDYVDPSYEKPVYKGMLPGGAEESDISPLDFITEVPSLAKGALKGLPALMGVIKKKVGSELPEEMSLLERIKLAAKRSGVKAPEMEAAQAEREALRNKPKDFFDKVKAKDTRRIFEENEKKLAKVPGKWNEGSYSKVTEELPIEFLDKYKGNPIGKTDIEALKKSIQEEGLKEPLILSFDPETSKIKLGEGNHRLEALRQLGYTHAPVRGYRSSIDDVAEKLLGAEKAEFSKVPFKSSTDKIDPGYYPADMKPSDIIDFDKLKNQAEREAFKEEFKSGFEPGWYHGTPLQEGIDQFKPGSFFTRDPEFANVYTKKLEPSYAGMVKDETQGHIVPVNLRTNNFFDSQNPEHLEQFKNLLKESFEQDRPNISEFPDMDYRHSKLYKPVMEELMNKETHDPERLAQAVIDHIKDQKGDWMGLEDKELQNLLKNRGGYSGMFVRENTIHPVTGLYTNKELKNALAFDPHDIRLPWAKFDPKNALSDDTLAGLAAAGLSFDQIKELLNKKQTDKDEL